jgi:predicted transposase YbfD/YdcC
LPKKTLEAIEKNNNTIVLQVKSNQQFLLDEVDFASKNHKIIDNHESIEKLHGRIEFRSTDIFDINIIGWESIKLGATVIRKNSTKRYGNYIDTYNKSYYVVNDKFTALELQTIIRNHWKIEATHHNIRDTVLCEDANKIRVKPENMMIIRSFAYNLIQANLKRKNFTNQVETNKLNFADVFNFKGI